MAMTDMSTRRPVRPSLGALLAVVALLVGACAAGAAPSMTPIPTAPAETGALTRDEAVALVLASDPMFAGIGTLDPDLIGQSAWYEVSPGTVGWRVTITKGWGDCQAGCISRHVWVFEVDGAGAVNLVEERGDPLEGVMGMPGPIVVAVPDGAGGWAVADLGYDTGIR